MALSKRGGMSPVGPQAATRKRTRASSMNSRPSSGASGATTAADAEAAGPSAAEEAGGGVAAALETLEGASPDGEVELAPASGAGGRAQAHAAQAANAM